jgi:hypothetical protein
MLLQLPHVNRAGCNIVDGNKVLSLHMDPAYALGQLHIDSDA